MSILIGQCVTPFWLIILTTLCSATNGNTCTRIQPLTPKPDNVGKILVGNFLNFEPAKTVEVCATRCVNDKQCQSMNFDTAKGMCYLNSKEKGNSRPADFKVAPASMMYMGRNELSEVRYFSFAQNARREEKNNYISQIHVQIMVFVRCVY